MHLVTAFHAPSTSATVSPCLSALRCTSTLIGLPFYPVSSFVILKPQYIMSKTDSPKGPPVEIQICLGTSQASRYSARLSLKSFKSFVKMSSRLSGIAGTSPTRRRKQQSQPAPRRPTAAESARNPQMAPAQTCPLPATTHAVGHGL